MKGETMKKIFIIMIVLLILTLSISACYGLVRKSADEVNVNALISETQLNPPCGENHLSLIWYIPQEFWQVSFSKDKTISEAQKTKLIETFKPYFILGVCQADVSALGAFQFYGKAEVLENLTLVFKDKEGRARKLTPIEEVGPDLEVFLGIIKPILSSAMGRMGQNFHFFVYEDYNMAGSRTISPYDSGILEFGLKERSGKLIQAELELPLNSLYIPRICSNGKEAHVTWKFCPWTGKKLPD